jgi:hypothetical protein
MININLIHHPQYIRSTLKCNGQLPQYHVVINSVIKITSLYNCAMDIPNSKYANVTLLTAVTDFRAVYSGVLIWQSQTVRHFVHEKFRIIKFRNS